jgi:hypothetical protein
VDSLKKSAALLPKRVAKDVKSMLKDLTAQLDTRRKELLRIKTQILEDAMKIDDPDLIAEIFDNPANKRLINDDVKSKIKIEFSTKIGALL